MGRARSSWKSKVVISLLWLNFVALWGRVYHITSVGDVTDSFNYLGGLISAYGLVVAWWIFHNIRIYRTKQTRTARLISPVNTHDTLQRYIAKKIDLHHEQDIRVDVIGDRKVFIGAQSAARKQPVPVHGSQ